MDALRFDFLAKELAVAGPRRGVLRRIAALALPLVSASPGLPGTVEAAKHRRRHKQQHPDRQDRVHNEGKKKKRKKKCTKAGQTPKKGRRCCRGLVKDGAGRCAEPTVESCASICDGCCDGETCVPGTSAEACGANGVPCGVCGTEAPVCVGGACRDCDVCISGCPFASVQAAITAASAGATIRICPGTYRENLTIDKKLTLRGSGQGTGAGDTILQGIGNDRVVTIPDNEQTVKLQQLRITGGVATSGFGAGGGIFNAANLLTIEDSTITGNRAVGGSGIWNESASRAVMQRCTISMNTNTDSSGGGVDNRGQMTLIGCTVSENRNLIGHGGGISNNGTLRVQACSVRQNTARGGSGIFNNGITFSLEQSDVTANTATAGDGGGVFNVAPMTITDSTISGNTSPFQAGGIANTSALVLDNSSVTDNSALVDGGGIFNGGSGSVTLQNDSSVSGNFPNNCVGPGFSGSGCAAP